MKIRVITIHDLENNYGSTIQACALCEYLQKQGYDTELIDYKPPYTHHFGLVGRIARICLFPMFVIRQHNRFEAYFELKVKRTSVFKRYSELVFSDEADIYIVGSDQVWNEFYDSGKDPAYYLEFTNCVNKIAYSASLGQLQPEDVLLRIKKRTENFKSISVREKSSADQLRKVGMQNVKHVLDPIFLFNKEHYLNTYDYNPYGDYILVYSVNNDTLLEETALFISRKTGLKIVLIGGYLQKTKHNIYLRDAGPEEFINAVNHAKYVVTNSFHGTALSIILNKMFWVIPSKYANMRIADLLMLLNLNNRMINKDNNIFNYTEGIDYERINGIIDDMREKSQRVLREALIKAEKG